MLLTSLLMGEKTEKWLKMAKKVMKKLKEEVEEKGFKLPVHGTWEGRKEQDDCVLWASWRTSCVNAVRKKVWTMAHSVENAG